jgi:lipopolysaccharide transport system ATP-binding protein
MICNLFTPVYELNEGIHEFSMEIPSNFLNDETYKMDLFVVDNASIPIEVINDIITFEVIDDSERVWFGKFEGVIRPDCITFQKLDE